MSNGQRNTNIDFLRGLSILSVIFLHLNIRLPFKDTALGEWLPRSFYNLIFWSGYYGVCVFFVISGYLITRSSIIKWGRLEQINVKQFYYFRFARIMPLLVLIVSVLVIFHWLQVPHFVINTEKTSLAETVFAALAFHINYLEIQHGYLPGAWDIMWSLSIEEVFYLCFPLILLIMPSERWFVIVQMVFLIISPWARTQWYIGNDLGDRNYLAYVDAIYIGCLACIISMRIKFSDLTSKICFVIGCLLIFIVLYFRGWLYRNGISKIGLNASLLSLGTGLLLIHFHRQEKSHRLPGFGIKAFVAWLGKYSYEVYLTHMFIAIGIFEVYRGLNLSGVWLYWVYLLTIPLSGALGMLVARFFSQPANRWLRSYIVDKRGDRSR